MRILRGVHEIGFIVAIWFVDCIGWLEENTNANFRMIMGFPKALI